MAKIKIGKVEREMKFTLLALKDINAKYGSIENMRAALSSGSDPLAVVPDLIWLITMMVNQGIIEHNMDIKYGEAEGKEQSLLTEEYVSVKLDLSSIVGTKSKIFDALVEGMDFKSDRESDEEVDEVLAEIEESKNA